MEWVFGLFLAIGVGYLLLMIFSSVGDSFDFGIDAVLENTRLDAVFGIEDAQGLGCSAIAAFMAGFGAVGLVAARAGWSVLLSVLVALALGMVLARLTTAILRYVYAGQSTDVRSAQEWVGKMARVTIDIPAGKTGEAMLDANEVVKHAIREINQEPLRRGDVVEVVEVHGPVLHVRKVETT
jgi:membrane-bound ClpP family serine protease